MVILTGSFIQGFSKIAAPLTSILRISLSTSATLITVEYDEFGHAGSKLVKKSSKSWRIVKESKSFKGLKNLQRPLVQRNIYQSTDPPSSEYEELKQFFELFLLGPEALSIPWTITNKAKLVELLMVCRVFPEKPGRSSSRGHLSHSPAVTNNLFAPKFLSAHRTSSLRYFSSGIYLGHFGINMTRELVAHALSSLKSGEAPWKDVPAKDQLDSWEDVWKKVEKVEVFKNWRRYLEATSQS